MSGKEGRAAESLTLPSHSAGPLENAPHGDLAASYQDAE